MIWHEAELLCGTCSSAPCGAPGALAALSVFPEAHAALAGAGAGVLALEVLQREARRADHREQAGTPSRFLLT